MASLVVVIVILLLVAADALLVQSAEVIALYLSVLTHFRWRLLCENGIILLLVLKTNIIASRGNSTIVGIRLCNLDTSITSLVIESVLLGPAKFFRSSSSCIGREYLVGEVGRPIQLEYLDLFLLEQSVALVHCLEYWIVCLDFYARIARLRRPTLPSGAVSEVVLGSVKLVAGLVDQVLESIGSKTRLIIVNVHGGRRLFDGVIGKVFELVIEADSRPITEVASWLPPRSLSLHSQLVQFFRPLLFHVIECPAGILKIRRSIQRRCLARTQILNDLDILEVLRLFACESRNLF